MKSNNPRRRLRLQSDVRGGGGFLARMAYRARRCRWHLMGSLSRPPKSGNWVLLLFYHWVLDDEREDFKRQLRYLRNEGEFIGLDQAVSAVTSASKVGGRYFCLTFDDGFKNSVTNAMPVLKEAGVPAAFFLPTRYIGLDLDRDWEAIQPFYQRSYTEYDGCFEFLTWDDCRLLAANGFTLGSHTHSHQRLAGLSPTEVQDELARSKAIIEAEIGTSCQHFCCPWGKPHKDFDPSLHPEIARQIGYSSFLTTELGLNSPKDSAFAMKRIGADPDSDLRYVLASSMES